MPPAGFTPTWRRSLAPVAHGLEHDQRDRQGRGGRDLAGGGLDEVARRPASPATTRAGRCRRSTSSPVSRITLRWASAPSAAQASLTAAISSNTPQVAPGQERAAVDDHVDLVGAGGDGVRGVGELDRQRGAPGGERGGDRRDVDAGARRARRTATRDQVAVDADRGDRGAVGSRRVGVRALAHSERTLPGVSAPSSVVRSIIEIAMSIAHALAVVLIDRVARPAARASAPTWSTPGQAVQPGGQGPVGHPADAEDVARSVGGGGGAHRRSLARPRGLRPATTADGLRPAIGGRRGAVR